MKSIHYAHAVFLPLLDTNHPGLYSSHTASAQTTGACVVQGHSNDIRCLAIHPNRFLVATGQMADEDDGPKVSSTPNCRVRGGLRPAAWRHQSISMQCPESITVRWRDWCVDLRACMFWTHAAPSLCAANTLAAFLTPPRALPLLSRLCCDVQNFPSVDIWDTRDVRGQICQLDFKKEKGEPSMRWARLYLHSCMPACMHVHTIRVASYTCTPAMRV